MSINGAAMSWTPTSSPGDASAFGVQAGHDRTAEWSTKTQGAATPHAQGTEEHTDTLSGDPELTTTVTVAMDKARGTSRKFAMR